MADEIPAIFGTRKVGTKSVQLRIAPRGVQMWEEPNGAGMGGAILVLQMTRDDISALRDVLTVTLEN